MTDENAYYLDDSEHPIPYVYNLDVEVVTKDGRIFLGVTIAAPLQNDVRSQMRLLQKINNYIRYAISAEFRARPEGLAPERTTILVGIHLESHPDIFSLLEQCRPIVEEVGATLEIKRTSNVDLESD
ncbi:hypothetical protein [Labrys miyagiensis]